MPTQRSITERAGKSFKEVFTIVLGGGCNPVIH